MYFNVCGSLLTRHIAVRMVVQDLVEILSRPGTWYTLRKSNQAAYEAGGDGKFKVGTEVPWIPSAYSPSAYDFQFLHATGSQCTQNVTGSIAQGQLCPTDYAHTLTYKT